MTNEVAKPTDPMEEFKQRVTDKLRGDIGAMLPDEALAGLVQRAVEEQFFKPRTVSDGYGYNKKEVPSWFVTEVAKQAEPIIKGLVEAYVRDNEAEIRKAVAQFLADKNLMLVTMAAMQQQTQQTIFDTATAIVQQMRAQGF